MRARVKFTTGTSYHALGRPSFTRNQVAILSNEDDIRYFENQADFVVRRLKEKVIKKKPEVKKAVAPVETELPSWNSKSPRAVLVKACAARDIAVTMDDTNAIMVQMLQFDDDENGDG